MTKASALVSESPLATETMIAAILETLHHLPPERLQDVLQFAQFLEYKLALVDQIFDDEALWDAVEANQRFKDQHPDEPLDRYNSGKEFLEAVADFIVAYKITFSKAVRAQIQHLPGHVKPIAKQQIAALSDNPRPPQSKEMEGHQNYYRLWLGAKYRLVWHVLDDIQVVEIEYVGPKTPDLYEYLGLARPSNNDDE